MTRGLCRACSSRCRPLPGAVCAHTGSNPPLSSSIQLVQQPWSNRRIRRDTSVSAETAGLDAVTLCVPDIRIALAAAELRAAAYLRANSFYTYPVDRSPMAARGDSEWESITAKINRREAGYKDLAVICFIATIREDASCKIAQQVLKDMDASTKLPSDPRSGVPAPELVIGSLDLNVGAVLPAEQLIGRLPPEGAAGGRAYLSNVCVAHAARRQGVAQAIIRRAELEASQLGVSQLYVHVVHDNLPAVKLYQLSLGFEVEAEESVALARSLQRPRRLLLRKDLQA